MVPENGAKALQEIGPRVTGVGGQPFAFDDVEVGQRRSRGHRMSGIGEGVGEGAETLGTLFQRLPHDLVDDRCRQGHGPTGQALGDSDQVRLQGKDFGGEIGAQAPECADNLVRYQENVVTVEDTLNILPVPFGGRNDAPGAHDRLGDEGGDRVRSLGLDQGVEFVGASAREFALAHPWIGVAIVMRRCGVKNGAQG